MLNPKKAIDHVTDKLQRARQVLHITQCRLKYPVIRLIACKMVSVEEVGIRDIVDVEGVISAGAAEAQ